ncbi:MAG: response regulator [Halieaceae bacterium]|nr:response regulator [Halieaceae bacterium]
MKIMVVDDSKAMRLIVIKTLRDAGFGGHDIVQAADGQEALDLILEDEPDLILCDWNMPNMTGPELLGALKEKDITPPFGFVTTEATQAMKEQADELGANFLIAKPFTPDNFEDTLASYIK